MLGRVRPLVLDYQLIASEGPSEVRFEIDTEKEARWSECDRGCVPRSGKSRPDSPTGYEAQTRERETGYEPKYVWPQWYLSSLLDYSRPRVE